MYNTPVKKARSTLDMCWNLALLFAVFIGFSMLPDLAHADIENPPADNTNAIEMLFCNVVGILNGPTGKAIATVAIIAVGIGALLGKISWGMALIVALGIALIFGAASIVNVLAGGASGSVSSCTGGNLTTDLSS